MKHSVLRTGLSVLLLLAMLAASLPAAFGAEGSNLFITGYRVTNTAGSPVYTVTRGNVVDITVSIKDTGDGTGDGDPKTLDITKLDDSFTGGTLSVEKNSPVGAPLVYAVKLGGLTYKGVGQSLKLQVGTAGQPDSYQTLELTITEAVVYEAPQPTPEPVPTPPEPIPAPNVLVSRSELRKPIEAGQQVPLTITFQNLSSTRLTAPVVTLTPTDGISIVGGSSSFSLPDIPGKKSVDLNVMVQAASTISTPAQSIGVDLKFNYFNNLSVVQGTMSDKLNIPALGRESVPQPVVLVSRTPLDHPLAPDESATVTIQFQNTGSTRLVKPTVTVTPSESLVVLNDAATFLLPNLDPGRTARIEVQVKVAKGNTATSQSLGTELKFGYDSGGMLTQATVSDKVVVPTLAKESVPQPVVLVSRGENVKPLSPGETASVSLIFQNASASTLVKPVVTVSASESLMLLDPASTFLLPDLEPGQTASIAVKVKAAKDLTAANQSLSTELKFNYDNGEALTQGTSSDKINLSANVPVKGDASVPNVVVRSFAFGESSVAAGSAFPLTFSFENTGAVKIENVVVVVDGGENFTMNAGTNTYFYKAMAPGATQSQEVPMRVIPAGKTGAQSVVLSFKYEYSDGEKRAQATSDVKLSIPVYQPDRFQINAPSVPESVSMGEETELLLTYVNKGKDDLANLEATVVGDGVETPARTQYLGNVTAGANGNIGFALTPMEEGDLNLVLKISYENADQQVQTREFPVTLHVEAAPPIDDFPDDYEPEAEGGSFPWLPVGLAGGGAAIAGGAALLVWKKKRGTAAAGAESWDNWDDETPGGEA